MSNLPARSTTEAELTQASFALAQFFDGIVITDLELAGPTGPGASAPVTPAPPTFQALPPPAAPAPCLPVREPCPAPPALTAQRSPEAVPVSLTQLREWYAIARSLGRGDRLRRIAQLGVRFKRQFGEAEPDRPRRFAEWSAQEVSWWLADLAAYSQQRSLVSNNIRGSRQRIR